jgi:hypothetical protein
VSAREPRVPFSEPAERRRGGVSLREEIRVADHHVRLTTGNFRIRGIDLEFEVRVDGSMLGTLSVSEGGLHGRPRHGRKPHGIPIGWTEFADWATSS